MPNPSVLIVGAGPAGLTSALLLARYGVSVTLVERHPGTSVHPKSRGLNVRTMEILRSLGLEDAVKQAGQSLAKNKYMLFVETLAGKEIRRIADDDLMLQGDALSAYTPCTWTQCAQDILETLLAKEAQAAGAALLFGHELVSFDQDTTGVRARIRDCVSGGEQSLQAEYMLACDGANSPMRKRLGIAFEGRAEIERFINVYFRADLKRYVDGRWFGICFVENPTVQGLFLPVDNEMRWLFNIQSGDGIAAGEELTPETYKRLIHAAIGDETLEVEILSALPWAASAVVVPRLRENRVFLLGDAGHIMPPAGGFGLNVAVQEAHNLAWKLAHVLNGKAEASLLDSYEEERLPVARDIVHYSEQEMDSPHPWEHGEEEHGEHGHGAPEGDDENDSHDEGGEERHGPWEASLEEQLQAVIGFQYRSNAVMAGPLLDGLNLHGQPGTRFPHVWLETNRSTLDLLTGDSSIAAASNTVLNGSHAALPVIRFPQEIWTKMMGPEGPQAVLVRPDGIVAGEVLP